MRVAMPSCDIFRDGGPAPPLEDASKRIGNSSEPDKVEKACGA